MRNLVKMVVVVMVSMAMRMDAHTPVETNDAVRTMLQVIASPDDDNWGDSLVRFRILRRTERRPFYDIGIDGWTRVEKEAAFLSYLNRLRTMDFGDQANSLSVYAADAVQHCHDISFTNAVSAIMGLMENQTCPIQFRCTAIRAYVKLCTVDDESTCFVERVTTNHLAYSVRERGLLRGLYADKLMPLATSSNGQRLIYDRAVRMFYRHRMKDVGGASMLDTLFSTAFDGYTFSSNRLEVARFVLDQTNCNHLVRRNFTVITNQLLSTSQPLRQLNLEGNEQ